MAARTVGEPPHRLNAASSRSDNEKVDRSWRIQDQASRAGRCGNG